MNRVKIIATDVEFPTGAEMKFFDSIDELPLLPSSEFFYLIDDNDDIMVKQGVSVDDYWQHYLHIESHLKKLFSILTAYKPSMNSSSFIVEKYGKWHRHNDTFKNLQSIGVTSRRRQNLRGSKLKASLVVTNNDTLNHLNDYL